MTQRPRAPIGPRDIVRVELADRGYDISIRRGNLALAVPFLQPLDWTHAVVIADANVLDAYAKPLAATLQTAGRVDLISVPPGEASKSPAELVRLWNELRRLQTDRRSIVVAVGGGVVGDLAGFTAATYARGLRFIQVPTTLLAQVDSSVGGKTAINLPTAKNMVGAFWQPAGVLVDIDTLQTLPDREYRAGLAEVVKYGLIMDAPFFDYLCDHVDDLTARSPTVLQTIVSRCCELKAEVVREDERETTGRRAILNYGHTFAHALETTSGYGELLHGEAVAIGMTAAARLAQRLGRVDESFVNRQTDLLTELRLPTQLSSAVPISDAMEAVVRDKKVESGTLFLVLPTRIGHVERVSGVSRNDVAAAFAAIGCTN